MDKVSVLGTQKAGRKSMVALGCLMTSVFGAELQCTVLVMFLVPGAKYLARNKLREGGFTFCYKPRAHFIFVEKAWLQGCEAVGHIAP